MDMEQFTESLKGKKVNELLELLKNGLSGQLKIDPDSLDSVIEELNTRKLTKVEKTEFEQLMNISFEESQETQQQQPPHAQKTESEIKYSSVYNKFCKRCEHYEFNLHQGILCGLTHQKPDFIDVCDKFVINKIRDEKISTEELQKNESTSSLGKYLFLDLDQLELDEKLKKDVYNLANGCIVYAAVVIVLSVIFLVQGSLLFLFPLICSLIIILGSVFVFHGERIKALICYRIGGFLTIPAGLIVLILVSLMESKIKKSIQSRT